MNILLLGSGGREHALAWKLVQSKLLTRLFIAPGNAGTATLGTNVDLHTDDFKGLGRFAIDHHIKLVVVGPEDPLVKGIHDYFLEHDELSHIHIIGPAKHGAMLEGSKNFAKQFMKRHQIPTANYHSFTADQLQEAIDYLQTVHPPYVLKADGLAAGKGVMILNDMQEAVHELQMMFSGKFGQAGSTVVIEEFLKGIELSVFVLTDGKSYILLPEAKDYKRIGEGETGLNTGGMGSVSPVPFADRTFMKKVEEQIVKPTIKGLQNDHIPYQGFIFIGLMNVAGEPYVIEYNVRLGDPETESIMPRINNDLLEMLLSVTDGSLDSVVPDIDERTVVTLMLVSGGYPGSYEKNKEIKHIDQVKDGFLFHAGTRGQEYNVYTNGGRVLAVGAMGKSIREALLVATRNAETIDFVGKYFRRDIGFDLVNR